LDFGPIVVFVAPIEKGDQRPGIKDNLPLHLP
jgi:hypothetical protein